jgi:type IV pilus assembly protein PilC
MQIASLLLLALMIASPTVRWSVPVIGRLYRRDLQGSVLRNLGLLVDVEVPLPAAFDFLAVAPEIPRPMRRRLAKAAQSSRRGDALAEVLAQNGLMPRSHAPLVATAERTQSLVWTLRELGDQLSQRALRFVRRLAILLGPLILLILGAVVGFTAIALFVPLVQMLAEMSQ